MLEFHSVVEMTTCVFQILLFKLGSYRSHLHDFPLPTFQIFVCKRESNRVLNSLVSHPALKYIT